MKRIIWHWSAGSHSAGEAVMRHYHFGIEGDGRIVAGYHAPEANRAIKRGAYAAHTRGFNTGSIGVAFCAIVSVMVGLTLRHMRQPITEFIKARLR